MQKQVQIRLTGALLQGAVWKFTNLATKFSAACVPPTLWMRKSKTNLFAFSTRRKKFLKRWRSLKSGCAWRGGQGRHSGGLCKTPSLSTIYQDVRLPKN